jgi:hypothetical protein
LLAPLALVVETCLAAALVLSFRGWPRVVRYASAAAVALWLIGASSEIVRYALPAAQPPESEAPRLAHWLRAEGSAYTLYTNNPSESWHLSHRSSRLLPRTSDEATLRSFSAELARRPSAVVGFNSPLMDLVLPESVAERAALGKLAHFEKANIWLR